MSPVSQYSQGLSDEGEGVGGDGGGGGSNISHGPQESSSGSSGVGSDVAFPSASAMAAQGRRNTLGRWTSGGMVAPAPVREREGSGSSGSGSGSSQAHSSGISEVQVGEGDRRGDQSSLPEPPSPLMPRRPRI